MTKDKKTPRKNRQTVPPDTKELNETELDQVSGGVVIDGSDTVTSKPKRPGPVTLTGTENEWD